MYIMCWVLRGKQYYISKIVKSGRTLTLLIVVFFVDQNLIFYFHSYSIINIILCKILLIDYFVYILYLPHTYSLIRCYSMDECLKYIVA